MDLYFISNPFPLTIYTSSHTHTHTHTHTHSEESQFVQKCWKDVRVGDFVRLMCDELIPADILLLHSADEDGLCYIQTSNLDGETNLKQRHVVKGALEQQKQSVFDSINEHVCVCVCYVNY